MGSGSGCAKEAEDRLAFHQQNYESPPLLPPELKVAFSQIATKTSRNLEPGRTSPDTAKKGLVTLPDRQSGNPPHRTQQNPDPHYLERRRNNNATVTIAVGAFRNLSSAAEMEATILELSQQGKTDEEIAQHLTELGHVSPKNPQTVLPSTVKTIRLKHHIFQKRSQSHPRHIPGYLTIPQIAPQIGVTAHWIYHLIRRGKIEIDRDDRPACTYSRISPKPWICSDNSKQAPLRTCVFKEASRCTIKVRRNVTLNNPLDSCPGSLYFQQCCVAASCGPETMRVLAELGFVIRIQNGSDYFLQ